MYFITLTNIVYNKQKYGIKSSSETEQLQNIEHLCKFLILHSTLIHIKNIMKRNT